MCRIHDFQDPSQPVTSALTAPFCSALRSQREFNRQMDFLNAAAAEGKLVHRGETDAHTRRMGISIVRMSVDDEKGCGGLMADEIFGPVLPVLTVKVCPRSPARFLTVIECERSDPVRERSTASSGFVRLLRPSIGV